LKICRELHLQGSLIPLDPPALKVGSPYEAATGFTLAERAEFLFWLLIYVYFEKCPRLIGDGVLVFRVVFGRLYI
jgi:hypothetical protein